MNHSIFRLTILVMTALITFSCAKEDETKQIQPTFENSVAIVQNGLHKSKSNEIITLEIINFNDNYELADGYNIDGNKYSDDGEFNDQVAGDGIYTFIEDAENFNASKNISNTDLMINFGEDFQHRDKLNEYLNVAGFQKGGKIGCSFRTTTCVETNWWNSCWPLSSPCTCVEFYDCKVEISF